MKWSAWRSRAVDGTPPGLLALVREEIGRANRRPTDGEVVFVSVTVFRWDRRPFGWPPRVGYEVVGRDRAGQIVWLGEDSMDAPRHLAENLTEADELLVAREIGRRLRRELGR